MIKVLKMIIENVLTALYQPFGFSVIMAVLAMFVYMYAREKSTKALIWEWVCEFKKNSVFRRIFLLVFYSAMILFRTLLNRDMWANPLSDVIGIWGIYTENGELTTEVIENLALFIPFTILLLWSMKEKILGDEVKLSKTLWKSAEIVFLASLTIELLQLFLRLGTFQVSDLFYNTLGGVIGGFLYWLLHKMK